MESSERIGLPRHAIDRNQPLSLATRVLSRPNLQRAHHAVRSAPPPTCTMDTLVPFEKNFYEEHPDVTALSPAEVQAWRQQHNIDVSDDRAPKPVRTFLEAAFPEYLVAELETSGFQAPTAIH